MNPMEKIFKHALAGIKKPADEQGKTRRTNSKQARTLELSSISDKLNGSAADEARKVRRNSTKRGSINSRKSEELCVKHEPEQETSLKQDSFDSPKQEELAVKHELESEEITLNSVSTQHADQQATASSSVSTKSMQEPTESTIKLEPAPANETDEESSQTTKDPVKKRPKKASSVKPDSNRIFQQAIGVLVKDRKENTDLKKEELNLEQQQPEEVSKKTPKIKKEKLNSEQPGEEIPKKKKTSKVKKEKLSSEEAGEGVPKKKTKKKSSKVKKEEPNPEQEAGEQQPIEKVAKEKKKKKLSRVKKEEQPPLENHQEEKQMKEEPPTREETTEEASILKTKPKRQRSTRKRSPSSEEEELSVQADAASTSKQNGSFSPRDKIPSPVKHARIRGPVVIGTTRNLKYPRNRILPPVSRPAAQQVQRETQSEDEESQAERKPLPPHATPTKTARTQPVLDGSIMITPFFTKAYPFSNHFRCFFYVDKNLFNCTEQYYMYYKARVFGDHQSAKEIMKCSEARDMKRIGSHIRHFNTEKWRRLSSLVMSIGNYAKYSQNPELRRYLFDTGNSTLVEASPDDTYWGIGISVDNSVAVRDKKNWPGKNVLGRILTRIRDKLKEKPEFQSEVDEADRANRRITI